MSSIQQNFFDRYIISEVTNFIHSTQKKEALELTNWVAMSGYGSLKVSRNRVISIIYDFVLTLSQLGLGSKD